MSASRPEDRLRVDVSAASHRVLHERRRPRQRRSGNPPTAATRGRSSRAGCRPDRSAASVSTSIASSANIVYAPIEGRRPRWRPRRRWRRRRGGWRGRRAGGGGGGGGTTGVYRTDDGGATWRKFEQRTIRGRCTSVRFASTRIIRIASLMGGVRHARCRSTAARRSRSTRRSVGARRHHAIWIDPNNSNHVMIGTDGGVYASRAT